METFNYNHAFDKELFQENTRMISLCRKLPSEISVKDQ